MTEAEMLAALSAERARADRAEEERDLAVAHDRQPYPTAEAYERVCAARTALQARAEAAEWDAASFRERVGELASKFADPGTALDTQEKYLAREVLRLLSAPSSSPAATRPVNVTFRTPEGHPISRYDGTWMSGGAPSPAATGSDARASPDHDWTCSVRRWPVPGTCNCGASGLPASSSESDATTTSNEEG